MLTIRRDHLGRCETPAPPPGILLSEYYRQGYGYSCYRPSGTKDWLIMYTLSGHGIVVSDENPISCLESDIVIIPPNTPHIYYTAEDSVWEKIWCHFLPKPEWTDWIQLPKKKQPLIHLHIEDKLANEYIISAAKRLLGYSRSIINTYREELSLNALEEMLLLTLHDSSDPNRMMDGRVKEALNYLTHHYAEDFQIEELAKKICLSSSRLSHLFKEQVGETIIDMLVKIRLKQAERLLKFTNRQITEIAFDVGFHSSDYFTRKFKDYYKVNPSLYRQRYKDNGKAGE